MKLYKIRILIILTLCTSCTQSKTKDTLNQNSELRELKNLDTITSSGWKINYFTKLDTADLILKWSKNSVYGEYIDSNVFKLKSDFIPGFSGESEDNIFMTHRCASDCEAVLVLSKTKLIGKNFSHLISYDTIVDKVVYVDDVSYTDENAFKIVLTNLKSFKDTTISFKNLALGSFKVGYVDSVRFSKNGTYISALLIDRSDYNRQKNIRETKVIKF